MVRQNRWFVKIGVTSNQWYVKIGGLVKILPKIPHWYQQDGKYWTSCNTATNKIVKSGNYNTTSTTTMSLLPHIPHYTGGSNACAAAQPLFCHISGGKVTVKYMIWHTQPEVCPLTFWDHYKKNLSSNCWVDNPGPCPASSCSSITLCSPTSPSSPISWN